MADNVPWTTRRLSPSQIADLSDEEKSEGYKQLKAAYDQAKNAGAAGAVDLGKLSSNLQNLGAKLGNKGWAHPKYDVVSTTVVEKQGKKPVISVTKKDEEMPLPASLLMPAAPVVPPAIEAPKTGALPRLPLGVAKNRQVQAPAPIQLTDIVTTPVEEQKKASVPDAGAYSWLSPEVDAGVPAQESDFVSTFPSEEMAQAEMVRRQKEMSELDARAAAVQEQSDKEMKSRQDRVRAEEAEKVAALRREQSVVPEESTLDMSTLFNNMLGELGRGTQGQAKDVAVEAPFVPNTPPKRVPLTAKAPEPVPEVLPLVEAPTEDVTVVSPSRQIAQKRAPTVTFMGQPLEDGVEGPIEPPRTIQAGPEKKMRAQLPGGFLVDGLDVQTRPELEEAFITYSPKPQDTRTPEEKSKASLLKNQLALALETFGRRSAGLNLQQMPELTTPKLYQMEQDMLNRDIARERVMYDRTQRDIDRSIAGENRLFQRAEQLRDNIRAVDRQITDLSIQESQLNIQENDVRERLSKAGFGTAYIEGQVAKSFGAARKALNNQRDVLRGLKNQYEGVYGQLSAAQTTPVPAFSGGQVPQVGGFVPPAAGAAPVVPGMTPPVAPAAGGRVSGGSGEKPPSYADERTRMNTVDIGDGRKVVLKPQFSGDLKDLQKQALTFKQSLEATKGIEKQLTDLFKVVENPNSSMEEVNKALSAIRASVGNASGKALAAEGLSSTVEALRGVEHALSPGVASTWLNAGAIGLTDKLGVGQGAAKNAFNTWRSGVQASVGAYKKAVEHARDTWAEQYGDPAGGGSVTFRHKKSGKTKSYPANDPNVAKFRTNQDFEEVK